MLKLNNEITWKKTTKICFLLNGFWLVCRSTTNYLFWGLNKNILTHSYTHIIIFKAIFTENFFYNAWNLQSLQSVTTGSSLHMSIANLLVFFINNSTKYKNAVFWLVNSNCICKKFHFFFSYHRSSISRVFCQMVKKDKLVIFSE